MDLDLIPESANLILAADVGIQISFGLKVKADSPRFKFPEGGNIDDVIFSLNLSLASQSQRIEDGRIGEMRPAFVRFGEIGVPRGPLIMITTQVADDQFNLVYIESSKGNFPSLISIGISDEPENSGLTDDVWTGPENLAVWNINFFFGFAKKN